jgi:uncharacterized membrane protein YfcA
VTFSAGNIVLLVAAGLLAGAINAAAGGGSLISFPALVFAGLPSLTANVTNTVALSLGYLGGAAGFREELRHDAERTRRFGRAAAVGALIGVVLIEISSPDVFDGVVPWLVLIACGLLAAQPLVAERVKARQGRGETRLLVAAEGMQVAAGAYGAYFGAGLGVMVLALLGIGTGDTIAKLNPLKSAITLIVNVIAAACFVVIAPVDWGAAAFVGPASLVGGRVGAGLAKRLPSEVIRRAVVCFGVVVALKLLLT